MLFVTKKIDFERAIFSVVLGKDEHWTLAGVIYLLLSALSSLLRHFYGPICFSRCKKWFKWIRRHKVFSCLCAFSAGNRCTALKEHSNFQMCSLRICLAHCFWVFVEHAGHNLKVAKKMRSKNRSIHSYWDRSVHTVCNFVGKLQWSWLHQENSSLGFSSSVSSGEAKYWRPQI